MLLFISLLSINASNTDVVPHYFMAYVIQGGKQLYIDKHVVKVKKAPFQVVVDMFEKDGVFVYASFNGETYEKGIQNTSVQNLYGFKNTAIYEVWKNPNEELCIDGNSPNFWFIDSPTKHRFTSYENINGRYLCVRNINHFYNMKTGQEIDVKNVNGPLYFTFIKFKQEGANYRSKELMRHGFKIELED